MIRKRTRLLLVVAGAVGVLAGCHKDATTAAGNTGGPPTDGPPTAAGPAFDAESEPHAAGKKVMVSSNCFRCHAVNGARPGGGMPGPGGPGGPKGRGGMGGPDPGHVGQEPTHTTDWLAQYVQNPKSVKADSKMPAFEGKMSEGDLKALAEYLASLK